MSLCSTCSETSIRLPKKAQLDIDKRQQHENNNSITGLGRENNTTICSRDTGERLDPL